MPVPETKASTPAKVLAWLAARLRGRADSEHEMSFNRLAFACIIVLYLLLMQGGPADGALNAMAVYVCLAFGILVHILARPQICRPRRAFALLLDLSSLSWQLHLGGDALAIFFPIYLWVIFGNGFRFGVAWLRGAMAVGVISFGAMVATTAFWLSHAPLSAGLLVGLILLPLYAGTLIRKLSHAKQLAEHANRAKTMFLASVSHELRTPLNAIIGTSSLLGESEMDAPRQDMVQTIDTAAKSLLALIDGILDFSRIEAGDVRIQVTEFDLLELLAEVRQVIAVQAHKKGLQLAFHVTVRTPQRLRGGRRQILEILLNLAANALKFTHTGGATIAVDAVADEGARVRLRFQVADTGIGIAPEAQYRIFDSFAQADETIINRYGGTGLGLTICKRLVEALGGEIGVESAAGVGSTFWFTVEVERIPALECHNVFTGRVILLSGDTALNGQLALALASEAHELQLAQTVEQAAGLLSTGRVALVPQSVVFADCRELGGEPAAVAAALRAAGQVGSLSAILVEGAASAGIPDATRARDYVTVVSPAATLAELRAALRIAAASWNAQGAAPRAGGEIREAKCKLRILVADDNQVNQKVLAKILEKARHQVHVVGNGEEALDALEALEYDAVLMDLNMPVMDGVEATKMYRVTSLGRRRAVIIGLTADATREAAERCMQAGMDACLTKPIEPVQLLDAIAAAVGQREPAPTAAHVVTEIASHPLYRPAARAAVDERTLADLLELGGPAFLDDLISTFLAKADGLLRSLQDAVVAGDVSEFRAHTHALASAGANLGIHRLVDLCRSTQDMKRSDLAALGPTYLERLADELQSARTNFRGRTRGRTAVGQAEPGQRG